MTIEKGNKVKVEYEGKLDNGELFDSTKKAGQPLEFEIGAGKIIPAFEEALIGMEKGQEKEIKLTPDKAYGEYKDEMVKDIPKEQLPQDKELKPGMMLIMNLPNGARMPVKITDVKEDKVTLDLNHPLAGKNLTFNVKILDVQEGGSEQDSEEKGGQGQGQGGQQGQQAQEQGQENKGQQKQDSGKDNSQQSK